MLVRTTLGWTFYSFFYESFGFLKGIFQNPLKRSARQGLAAFLGRGFRVAAEGCFANDEQQVA